MRNIIRSFLLSMLAAAVLQGECRAQNSRVPWSAFDAGFGNAASPGAALTSVVGQSLVGTSGDGNVRVAGGFLPGLLAAGTSALTLQVSNDWNMVSVPLSMADYTSSAVFPSAASPAFAYEGLYAEKNILKNGVGYWVKFAGAQTIQFSGYPRADDSMNVVQGWNMIGSTSGPIAVQTITSAPGGIVTSPFYGYDHGYVVAANIEPGNAYWVRAGQAGTLFLSPARSAAANRIHIVPTSDMPPPPPQEGAVTGRSVPATYALAQNFPNPFNPATEIRFALPADARVRLEIFSLAGQRVALLVDGDRTAGYHASTWNASMVASGLYFCRIEAIDIGDPAKVFTHVRKMVLMR